MSSSGSASGWTVMSTAASWPLVRTLSPFRVTASRRLQRLLKGAAELVAQPLAGHGKDVPVGLPGRRLQVPARPPADVEDVPLVARQDGRRGIAGQDELIRQRLEVGGGPLRLGRRGLLRRHGDEGGGKLDGLGPGRGVEPPVNPRLGVQGGEEIGERADRLGAPQKQDAAGVEAVVKERDELFLELRGQVDQEVPADQDVELREGRVHDDVLGGKDRHLADLLAHPVAPLLLDEEPAQALRRNVRGDVGRIDPRPGLVDGVPVQVGGEDLERNGFRRASPSAGPP